MRVRILVGMLVLAALAAGAWLWSDRAEIEAEFAEPALAVRAGRPTAVPQSESASGTIRAESGTPTVVKAPSWNGLVTAVHVAAGDTVSDGTPVVSLDGIVRKLAVTEAPFHRFLTANDSGDDVVALHDLLHRWGHLAEIPSRPGLFQSRTRTAVRSLAAEIGADSRTRSFDPAWLVWAPDAAELAVATVSLEVGAAAPQHSEIILESTFGITAYSLETEKNGRPFPLEGSWLLQVNVEGLASIEMTATDNQISEQDLAELLSTAAQAGAIELEPQGRYSFTFSGESTGRREVLSVPATSLRASADAATLCVFVRSSTDEPWSAVVVQPEEFPGSNIAIADMPELAEQEVLFNPSEVLEDPYCP